MWLLTIARRACADHRRAVDRLHKLHVRVQAQPTQVEPDPADLVSTSELINRLRGERRVAFVLTQLLGLPYAEVARIEGVPIGTIRSRVARARNDLVLAMTEAGIR